MNTYKKCDTLLLIVLKTLITNHNNIFYFTNLLYCYYCYDQHGHDTHTHKRSQVQGLQPIQIKEFSLLRGKNWSCLPYYFREKKEFFLSLYGHI